MKLEVTSESLNYDIRYFLPETLSQTDQEVQDLIVPQILMLSR